MQATGGIKALFANFLFSRTYISTIGQARAIAHLAPVCLFNKRKGKNKLRSNASGSQDSILLAC